MVTCGKSEVFLMFFRAQNSFTTLSRPPPQNPHEEAHHNYNRKQTYPTLCIWDKKTYPTLCIWDTERDPKHNCENATILCIWDKKTYLNDSRYAEIVFTSTPHCTARFTNRSGICILCAPEMISSPMTLAYC
jgi:hypothetical protein